MTVDPDLLEIVGDLDDWDTLVEQRPLTLWRAWHRDQPRTSQRSALQAVTRRRIVLVFGGNRSGKTELLRAVVVVLVLGSDHPDAAAFWRSHGIDPRQFPRGPGRGWIVALRSADSIEYHRQQVLALIPKWGPPHPKGEDGANWAAWGMDGLSDARLQVMVPGYSQPAEIVFKSDDPGPETMQGASVRVVLHDEESRKHGSATWEEAALRLVDQAGWHLMGNTPVRGKTWLYHEHVETRHDDEELVWIHSPDNPFLPRTEIARLERDPTVAAIRLRGEFVALEGRVWPQFMRQSHVVPRFEIPDGSVRFRTIDFGTRHPFVCLWWALLRRSVDLPDGRRIPDGSLVVYREHYRREWTLAQHVARIRELEAPGERFAATWCDPEDPQQMLQLAHTHGMEIVRANKAREAGLGAVAELLSPQADGLPGLWFVDECQETIREVENYCYTGSGPNASEIPRHQDDHACDCLRYGALGVRAYRGPV